MYIFLIYIVPFAFGMMSALPLAILARGYASLRLRKLGLSSTRGHEIGAALLIMYCGGILNVTVTGTASVEALAEAHENINLIPMLSVYELFFGTRADSYTATINIFGNIAVFAPFGFLLSLLWRGASWQKALLSSAAFSLAIELLQLPLPARKTDIDDIIFNALGGLIGYLFFRLIKPQTADTFRVSQVKTYLDVQE